VRALWRSVALFTQKVAPKEKVGIKNRDNTEMKRIDCLGKKLLPFITKPPNSSVTAGPKFHGFEIDFLADYQRPWKRNRMKHAKPIPSVLSIEFNSEKTYNLFFAHLKFCWGQDRVMYSKARFLEHSESHRSSRLRRGLGLGA
jgi:hypothetical protein